MARRRLPHISIWRCASTLLILGLPHPLLAEGSPIIGGRGADSFSTTLTLADAINTAIDRSPTVIAARAQWTQAQAKVDQARAQTRLTLSFNSTASESNATNAAPPPNHETFGSIVNSITMPVPTGRRPTLAVDQAVAQEAAAHAQFDSAARTQAGTVITDYFDLLKKKQQLVDAQITLDTAQRQLDEASLRNKAGDVPELDVIRAQVPVTNAQSGVVQAQNAIDIAVETLNAAIGRPISTPLTVAPPTSAAGNNLSVRPTTNPDWTNWGLGGQTPTIDDVERLAVTNSADIAAAQAAVHAQESARGAAKLWREPQLSLQASDTRSGDVTALSRQDTIQASVTVPLSDGGLARGQVREAEAAIDQAKANVDAATLQTQASAAAAYHNAVTTMQVADSAKAALDIAQTAYDKTVKGYHNGLFPLTDVLSAQVALAQARSAYTQAQFDAGAAQATLNQLISPVTKHQ